MDIAGIFSLSAYLMVLSRELVDIIIGPVSRYYYQQWIFDTSNISINNGYSILSTSLIDVIDMGNIMFNLVIICF